MHFSSISWTRAPHDTEFVLRIVTYVLLTTENMWSRAKCNICVLLTIRHFQCDLRGVLPSMGINSQVVRGTSHQKTSASAILELIWDLFWLYYFTVYFI